MSDSQHAVLRRVIRILELIPGPDHELHKMQAAVYRRLLAGERRA